jgi:hypothetical protein
MRTTLTLDDDVAAALEKLRKSRDQSLRAGVNEALRRGLSALAARPEPRVPFRTESVSLGRCLVGNVDNVADALAVAAGEPFR